MTKYIGVDPAGRDDGTAICILDDEGNVEFETFIDTIAYIDYIRKLKEQDEPVYFCIEDSHKHNLSYQHSSKRGVNEKLARNVGMNQHASKLTTRHTILEFGNEYVLPLSPQQKGAKWKTSKNANALQVKSIVQKVIEDERLIIKEKRVGQDRLDALKLACIMRKHVKF